MADRGSGQAPDPKIPVSSPHPTCSSSTMTGTQRAPRFEASLPPPRKLCLCPEVWSAAQQDSQTSSWERSPSLPRPCFPHPCEIGLTPSDHSCLERGFLSPRGPGLVHSGLPPGHLLLSSHCTRPELLHVFLSQGWLHDLGGPSQRQEKGITKGTGI